MLMQQAPSTQGNVFLESMGKLRSVVRAKTTLSLSHTQVTRLYKHPLMLLCSLSFPAC